MTTTDLDLFAWVGVDDSGDYGVIAVVTPGGSVVPAVFGSRGSAEQFRGSAVSAATARGRPVQLIRLSAMGVVDEVVPATRN